MKSNQDLIIGGDLRFVKWGLWILAILLGAATAFLYAGGRDFIAQKLIKRSTSSQLETSRPKFKWGALMRVFALNTPSDPFRRDSVDSQIKFLKDLGANSVRINYEGIPEVDDYIINSAYEADLEITLIIDTDKAGLADFWTEASKENGSQLGLKIAKRYKNRVKYYQLANEVSGVNIKKDHPGLYKEDYDLEKYKVFLPWILGISEGIKKSDPEAKRIVSSNWVGVGIIDLLVADGLKFEVIGWNWYSDMGDDLTAKKLDNGQILDIPGYLSKYKKEFWIVEANRAGGDFEGGENAQAEYLKTLLKNSFRSGKISGFFIFSLTDLVAQTDTKDGHWGLVKIQQNPTTSKWEFGGKKEAFWTYKQFIENHPYVPLVKGKTHRK